VDLCIDYMKPLKKIRGCGLPTSGTVVTLVNQCLRMAIEKQGDQVDAESVQHHIDIFLKDGIEAQTDPTPGRLFYSKIPILVGYSILRSHPW